MTRCSNPRPVKCGCGPPRACRRCIPATRTPPELVRRLRELLELEPDRVESQLLADRAWEREWLRDFHALRFGARLWVCPNHEQVNEPGAVVISSIRASPSAPARIRPPPCAWNGSTRGCGRG